MSVFRHEGTRTAQLQALLARRARAAAARRDALDAEARAALFRPRAIVFTDTADFTTRTARDGILHFLMVFDRATRALDRVVARHRGDVVKVEGDSLLLRFDDVAAACAAVQEMEATLQRLNVGQPAPDRLAFSYGIGWGEVLDLEHDVFGLEVNLASKLGEDLARPGEVLLTPAAVAALDPATLRRVVPYQTVTFGRQPIAVQRLRLPRRTAEPTPSKPRSSRERGALERERARVTGGSSAQSRESGGRQPPGLKKSRAARRTA